MNNNLLNLKLKTLLSKHTYYSNEIEYKNEIVHEAEPKFLSEINKHLKDNPELLKKINNIINPENVDTKFKQNNINESSTSGKSDVIDTKSKIPPSNFEQIVFREISKKIHPDKLKDPTQTQLELYSEASDAYSSHDIITLYKTAISLDIIVTIDENVIKQVEEQINKMAEKSDFFDKNLAYQWLLAVTTKERKKVIDFYIANIIKP